jgi:hypothetical protein
MNRCIEAFCVLLAVAIVGCTPSGPVPNTPLHRAALQIKAGMNRTNVESLFSDLKRGKEVDFQGKPGHVVEANDPPVIFRPDVEHGTKLSYSPNMDSFFDPFEFCDVYFDTNGVIVAYRYTYDR